MIDSILNVFFPERCRGCGIRGVALCTTCQSTVRLSEPLTEPKNASALYHYSDPIVRRAVWELKYQRKSPLAQVLITAAKASITKHFNSFLPAPKPVEIVLVPIPQHYTKTFNRGFNQSILLAQWIHSVIPYTTVKTLLRKIKATSSQAHTHNRTERQRNLTGTMEVVPHTIIKEKVLYIIIDDVITTGSTSNEASRALRAAGATYIYTIALAHGYAGSHT